MRFLFLLLQRQLSKSLKSRGALSCGTRSISPSSIWPSCLYGRRLLLRSTLKRLRKWLRSRQAELAQLEVELEEARRLIMQPTPPPTPPPSQFPRGHSSPRVSEVASSGMAVDAELLLLSEGEEKGPKRLRVGATGEEAPSLQQVLDAKETFGMMELESIMESFRQRHSLLEQEMIANEQRELEDALACCASGGRERRSRLSTTSPNVSSKVKSYDPSLFFF